MNVRAVAVNLAGAAANRANRFGRHTARRVQRIWRGSQKAVAGPVHAGRRAAAGAAGFPGRADKALVRIRKRTDRFREHVIEPWLEQRRIEQDLAALARGRGPIVVGPWLSEVGYEVLYWRPFLTWMLDRYRIAPERVIAVSRGGVAEWYRGIASRYVDLLDLFTPGDFAARNAARRDGGDQKQLAPGEFDAEILRRVEVQLQLREPAGLCHPSFMFRLFRRFWFGDRSLDFFLNHMRFERMVPAATVPGLPERFAAVKFYTGAAIPDSAEHRAMLRVLVSRVAETMPVVVMNTGLALDEHSDFTFDDVPNTVVLGRMLTPATNLAVQTQVMARASMFLGTCGSLAWLAPIIGTPAVGVYADDRFLTPHLFVAKHAYRLMDAAAFTTLDLAAVDALDVVPSPASAGVDRRRA